MGACTSAPIPFQTHSTYTGAGILFANGSVALAGVQKNWKVLKGDPAILSGFGGRRELSDADWFHTAWREVIEELFHIKTIPLACIHHLRISHPPSYPVVTSGYVLLRYTFHDLTRALDLVRRYSMTSPLYTTIPRTVGDLVTKRRIRADAEIGSLALIPTHSVRIASEFLTDMKGCGDP